MVCIAAFIILALIGVFVALISIFKPKIGKAYLKALKKAWGCLWKKVRLQKCETGFKEDVKNSLLSRVVIKHPRLVRPLSVLIEMVSIIIVFITIWAVLTAIKSLLALWALGSCNVTKPSECSLNPEIGCSIDEAEPSNFFEATGRWFTEWGEIFEAIPEKFKTYDADDLKLNYIDINNQLVEGLPTAIDVFDPGCSACMSSYRNQKESGFFDSYNVRLVPFPIQNPDGSYRFKNSELITRYMFATEQIESNAALYLLDSIFTRENSDKIPYQNRFNEDYSNEEAVKKLELWLKEYGLDDGQILTIRQIANLPETTDKIQQNKEIIENQLKAKGIPTMIIDGKKHTGLWRAE